MRYRKLTSTGDYTFGQGPGNFFVNSPACVAQAVQTRLGLFQGDWFLDLTAGTPYNSQVLGYGTLSSYALAIQQVILGTPNVTELVSFSAGVDAVARLAQVQALINTAYGQTTIQANL